MPKAILEYPGVVRLDVPVPPDLETVLGYEGQQRWVGFWWEPAGDELAWSDGASSTVGADWAAWQLWTEHPRVAPALDGYDFGSSDADGRHMLLLDREERAVYVVSQRLGHLYLFQNLTIGPPLRRMTLEEVDAAFAEHRRRINDPAWLEAEVNRRMAESARRRELLAAWLDGQAAS